MQINRGYTNLYWVIADRLKPTMFVLYYWIKSFEGFNKAFDLSQNQIAKATGLSKKTVNNLIKQMDSLGLIERRRRKGYGKSDILILKEHDFINKVDNKNTYNSERSIRWTLS
jgi:DNA-binding MarR family transcriptional regulator